MEIDLMSSFVAGISDGAILASVSQFEGND